jgi:hypothetical protein
LGTALTFFGVVLARAGARFFALVLAMIRLRSS